MAALQKQDSEAVESPKQSSVRVFWLLQVNWGMGHKKTPCKLAWTGSLFRSLAIPYFRMANCHTII
ncbi:hypothetical protein, partial [Methyloglobulus sp.]|uniref:hypothetical protein n=1 Tax=Methyloglobulus sp. TaxID=2518622 RepID=UPI0032B86016